jgi:hypothetical protein
MDWRTGIGDTNYISYGTPHPPLRGTLSRWERDARNTDRVSGTAAGGSTIQAFVAGAVADHQ